MRSEVVKFKTSGGTTYDSVNDWGFNLTHCNEQKPAPKFERVDVPGANGSIDLSAALTNDIPFEDRVVELTFFKLCADHSAALTLANTVASRIHGKQLDVQTPDSAADSTWYHGDVEITSVAFEDRGCEVNVKCTCDPFRISSTGGTQALTASTKSVVASGSKLAQVTQGDLDSNGLEFIYEYPGSGGWVNHNAVAATFADGDNLFDADLTNVRCKTCKTGESWKNSGVMRQSGQAIEYGATSNQWVERAVFSATNATSSVINDPRFPFTGNTHVYVFIESDTVTAMSSVTYDGTSHSAGIEVKKGAVYGDMTANGTYNSGTYSTLATYTPTLNQSISTVIDCGTVDAYTGQLIIDVIGLTCAGVTANVMFILDGNAAPTVYEEPQITQTIVSLPMGMQVDHSLHDKYTSMLPRAWVNKTNGDVIDAQSITDWPRDAIYIDFAAVDNSGWLQFRPQYNVEINDWPEKTATITNGSMPAYPLATTDANGAVIEYGGNINVVSPSATNAELPTLLAAGSNTISYTLPGSNTASATLTWPKGVL